MATAAASDVVRALLRARVAVHADVDREAAEDRLLVRTDLGGTMQLYELSAGELVELTALPEPVGDAAYVPGSRLAVVVIDAGGNERYQLYLLDLDEAVRETVTDLDALTALTSDARYGHHLAGVSPDGRVMAYTSNRDNGVDFDLWTYDREVGEHRLLYAAGEWLHSASGFSPDGRLISLLRPGERPLDLDLVLVDATSGEAMIPLGHPHEAALVGAPAWVDPTTFYASSNVGRDFAAIVRHDLASGETTTLAGTGERFDAEVVGSRDGTALVVIENRNGANTMRRFDPHGGAPGEEIPLPEPGVVSHVHIPAPVLSADGSRLYYTLSTPRLPGDVFSHDFGSGKTRRLTHSPSVMNPERLAAAEHGRVASFDGEMVPFFIFRRPDLEPLHPVVVAVHGGPEAQAMQAFNPVYQALVASGYTVVVPNVRGSTGYGKRYAALDDTTKRLDSVRDLAAIHGALRSHGLDAGRAALWGGSYGGYMVLAGVAFQPELWAAGVDIVGLSDLVTFLENTSAYRRAHREREYGSLQHNREFLVEASPMTHVDDIRAPLFVIHGRNDPRVPVSEAEQLVANLVSRGVRCELLIYADEGHGLARLDNRLDAYPRAIEFLDEVLGR
jgi:dipeptidyl aminopeptidase/acylaminoacyl peptidase